MEAFYELFQDGFFVVLICLLQIIVVIAGAYGISLIRKANKSIGLTTNEKLLKQIEKTIESIVVSTNQTIVTKLKENNPDGKLTDEQKDMIFNTVKTAVLVCLSQEEVDAIIERYFNIDDGLLYLIEKTVSYNHVSVTPKVDSGEVENTEEVDEEIVEDVDGETVEEVEEGIAE